MNFRIMAASEILNELSISEVLDIGCRGCEAKAVLPKVVSYYGNDLVQNESGSVNFVGDALHYNFGKTFECVIALDVIEHVDDPYALVDKLINIADKHLVISLPNVYDISHKFDFLTKNSLGSKYSFEIENRLDRHRWLMSYDEINDFYRHYAEKHNVKLKTRDIHFGDYAVNMRFKLLSRLILPVLGEKNLTRSVIGVFTKKS